MNDSQSFDNWITNYEASQRHKHQLFLKALKNEFSKITQQQRRDRLNQVNEGQVQGLQLQTSFRRGRPAASHQGKET
jgi:putative component of toxin-antitoxin plasmid stabilization module